MDNADKPRSFINRYFIVIVIVLWFIAWSARDVLAPSAEAIPEDEAAEQADAVPADDADAQDEAAAEDEAAEDDVRPGPARDLDDEGDPDPMTGAAHDQPYAQEDAEDEAAADLAAEREPAFEGDAAVEADAERAAQFAQAALQAGRDAYWRAGPRAAVGVLREGLEALPKDSVQRADLYGELGNALFAMRDFEAAMDAWEGALKVLPESERLRMIERLAPVYDRHHEEGAAHLDEYR
ncbi:MULTISPECIES: hypothetical protein [unclassified Thioalkalivibrio]|uniref:hypothetical protein n=1 Tax=unclassified Thioalkalivibrio TaxID=2621013 RepID=UPI0003617FE4|nr:MULTISPECIES: hypothetical protein [unclassified Thioalkalivibrio]